MKHLNYSNIKKEKKKKKKKRNGYTKKSTSYVPINPQTPTNKTFPSSEQHWKPPISTELHNDGSKACDRPPKNTEEEIDQTRVGTAAEAAARTVEFDFFPAATVGEDRGCGRRVELIRSGVR